MTITDRQIVDHGIGMVAITLSKPDAADKPAPATAMIRFDDCKTWRKASMSLERGIFGVLCCFLARGIAQVCSIPEML